MVLTLRFPPNQKILVRRNCFKISRIQRDESRLAIKVSDFVLMKAIYLKNISETTYKYKYSSQFVPENSNKQLTEI